MLAYPCLLQGEGVPTETPPDLSQGEGAPSKCLKHSWMGLPPLGEGWGGASHGYQSPSPWEGTEKLKPTIKLKVDDGETAVLPFIIYLF